MNTPFQEIFPTPGLKGVGHSTEAPKYGSPGGMESPFKDGPQLISGSKDGNFPVNFEASIPVNQGQMNTPFKDPMPMGKK